VGARNLTPYATCMYSWMAPPSRSHRMILVSVVSGWGSARSGAAWPRDLCGRWVLKGIVALTESGYG
jgi:hypothetical protein